MPETPGTPLPFSNKEVEHIREMLRTSSEPLVCLLCGGRLQVSQIGADQRVDCVPCRRTAIIRSAGNDGARHGRVN